MAAVDSGAGAFVVAATEHRRARAEALLEAQPAIMDDRWVRLALGRGGWDGDPNEPGGPLDWAPLLYVCHSCFAGAATARGLLQAGADPNASFQNEHGMMSALYGAAGRAHDPELTALLLEAGANPDDNESLYHATEAPDPACLALLIAHGAETRGTNALAHALDEERLEHVRLLLDAGADPGEGALLAHAVRRGRGAEIAELLVSYGAEIDRPGGETWRGDVPLRTAYQHAVLRGKVELAEHLAGLGAATQAIPGDAGVASIARGERPREPLPKALDVDQQEVVALAALRGHLELVVDVLGPGFAGVVGGSPPGQLLHHAAWTGSAEIVGRLLARGADPLARAGERFATPLAWAALGSQHHELPGRDYVAVAEALLAGGAPLEPRLLDVADGPLADWLESRPPT